jgi:hypothetical protein
MREMTRMREENKIDWFVPLIRTMFLDIIITIVSRLLDTSLIPAPDRLRLTSSLHFFFRREKWRFAPQHRTISLVYHPTQQSVAATTRLFGDRPPPNRPATNPPSQQGKRMVVKEAYTPPERYCYGWNCRNDATQIGWPLIHFSTNSYVESFPPSRGIKEVGGECY